MTGFLMCPKCGEFIEVHENSSAIICHHCGTLHTISSASNNNIYSKYIYSYNTQPDYTPRYSLKQLYMISDGKIGAIPSYKLHLTQRKVFQTACRVMNRGLYAQALDFFAIIPKFEGVDAKVQECRKAIHKADTMRKVNSLPAKKRKNYIAIIFGAILQGVVILLIIKILEGLLS